MESEVKVTLITTIRNKTNGGEYAKQVVRLLQNNVMEDAIHITKFVLVDNSESFRIYCKHGFAVGRTFIGKTLMQQCVSMKVSSFKQINKSFNKIKHDENKRNCNR